jgi:hypothetical protein
MGARQELVAALPSRVGEPGRRLGLNRSNSGKPLSSDRLGRRNRHPARPASADRRRTGSAMTKQGWNWPETLMSDPIRLVGRRRLA